MQARFRVLGRIVADGDAGNLLISKCQWPVTGPQTANYPSSGPHFCFLKR